jgi:hypothetical protein
MLADDTAIKLINQVIERNWHQPGPDIYPGQSSNEDLRFEIASGATGVNDGQCSARQ